MATVKKAQKGKKVTPTYKNLRMGVNNEYYQVTGESRSNIKPTSRDSARYRAGFEKGLKGMKGDFNEGNIEKMGRWEGQNVGKKPVTKNKMGGKIKKAQGGKEISYGAETAQDSAIARKYGIRDPFSKEDERVTRRGWEATEKKPYPGNEEMYKKIAQRRKERWGIKDSAAKSPYKKGGVVKKAQTGITESGPLSKVPAAGAMRKSKMKERSADGNYMTKTVTRETPAGSKTSTKVRRTAQGILRGAPKMNKYKMGGTLAPTKKSVGKTIGKLNKAKSGMKMSKKK